MRRLILDGSPHLRAGDFYREGGSRRQETYAWTYGLRAQHILVTHESTCIRDTFTRELQV